MHCNCAPGVPTNKQRRNCSLSRSLSNCQLLNFAILVRENSQQINCFNTEKWYTCSSIKIALLCFSPWPEAWSVWRGGGAIAASLSLHSLGFSLSLSLSLRWPTINLNGQHRWENELVLFPVYILRTLWEQHSGSLDSHVQRQNGPHAGFSGQDENWSEDNWSRICSYSDLPAQCSFLVAEHKTNCAAEYQQ